MNKKIIFAILGVFLMTSGIFVLISYVPTPANTSGSGGNAIPALNTVGETASVSTSVNYYYQTTASNSGITTENLPVAENSGYSQVSLGDTSATWSYGQETSVSGSYRIEYINIAIPSAQFWTNQASDTVELQTLAVMSQYVVTGSGSENAYGIGTIYANLTLDWQGAAEHTFSWSTTSLASDTSSSALVVYIKPQWDINYFYSSAEQSPAYESYGTANLNITLTPPVSSVHTYYWTTGGTNVNGYVTSTVESGTTYTTQTSLPAQAAVNYEIGYHFNSVSSTISFPSDFLSGDIVTENEQYATNAEYDSTTEAVPYSFAVSLSTALATDTITFSNPTTPNVDAISSYSVQYYLGSLNVAQSASETLTASPTYTYTQVSGTTNEASASFGFSGSTPSNDVFADYGGTLSTTFTPTVTVSNPYYTYAQNQLVPSLSGASSGSFTPSSGTASPSFTGDSATYTSASSPSWTVNLDLYGNRHPVYQNSAISLSTVNPQ